MDESILISKTEKYLNEIQNEKISLEKISKLESFKSVYCKLTKRLSNLQEMREDMDLKGYTAPYRSLNKYGSTNSGDIAFEEMSEVNRHGQYFRMKATAKKNILDRVKSAIDAHKIAIGHLEEFGIFKCESCSKSYKPSAFIELSKKESANNKNIENKENISKLEEKKEEKEECSCGCTDFKFEINKTGVYRLEIIPYLPLSGNYMVLMSEMTSWGRESFKKVLSILKQERKGVVKTVSAVIKFKENDRWIRKRVSLDSEYVDSYEEEIRKEYGKNVRIEFLQFHRTKPTIINDKHARTALAIGYAKYAENIVQNNKESILKDKISNIYKLAKYDEIVRDVKLQRPKFVVGEDSLEEWRRFETENRLKTVGLMSKRENLDPQLKQDINKRKNVEKRVFSEVASTLILWDIFKYYLTTSQDRRKRYGGPFPYLRSDIDRKQRRIFENMNKEVVNILKNNENEKIIELNNMDLLLNKKFNLEKKIKGSNIKINYVSLGAAIISSNCNIPVSLSSKTFDVTEKSVENEIKNINTFKRPKSDKTKKFLEMIKK
ncbi:hypothetical protein MARBORIA2_03100 [Methanobrevibacter arboriphilus]|jgi:Zn-finger domain-containing protein|uniref:Uncharacterized protein n=1 Tax=Methanobrevibacter arboriphilus TaxID=39441 RepID=A0ACA8R1R0_METAZ|nr:DUF530 domain-containing protein [Methanobrevibacter arboriphilus]BBL61449.1 hypothetical protein MarbSA_04890 [Methanobrevibacter arboriphilus]GLI11220.1 hypothetical protein MARBORIA2_03100 [Methanobrevibacter arboriphilus]